MATNPTETGLEAWWALEEGSGTRLDETANNNDLADNNTVTSATGKKGDAADFERATTEFLDIADNASLSFGDEDFSIGLWFKMESDPGLMYVINKYDLGAGNAEYAIRIPNDEIPEFEVSSDGSAGTSVQQGSALSAGNWYFVVGVHDATANTVGISIDGAAISTASHTTGCNDNTSRFLIGARDHNSGQLNYYDGLADEAFVYRKALSQDNIDWLYNGGNGRTFSELSAAPAAFRPTVTIF